MAYTYAGRYGSEGIIDATGSAQTSASVLIRPAGTGTSATLYTDRTKASTTSNPVATDSTGNFAFYADPGEYDLVITVGAAVTTKRVTVPPDAGEVASVINAASFGVEGDAKLLTDVAMSNGSAVLTSASANFTAADVGKMLIVHGAAPGGDVFYAYIASRQSATQVTADATSSATLTNARVIYGTDNYAALAAAQTAASALGAPMYLPAPTTANRAYLYYGELVLDKAHLIGPFGQAFSRTDSTAWQGAVLLPVSTSSDMAAIKTTKGNRGTRIANISIDMCCMTAGSSGLNFTRSQTKGIHIDGTWNVDLENIQIRHVPPSAAGLYIDDGSPSLGCFWGRAKQVFIDQYSKTQWQQGITDPGTPLTEGSKSTSAKGVVLYGATNAVTAWTFDQVTSYRGWYIKGAINHVFHHCHSENAPLHCVYVDGAGAVGLAASRLKFTGGFYENPGNEKASGDATNYQTFKAVTTPHLVRLEDLSSVGTGPVVSEWGDGFVQDYGDPFSDIGAHPTGDRFWRHGSLKIDRANVGQFTESVDVWYPGPYSNSTKYAVSTATLVKAFDSFDAQRYDPYSLYTEANGRWAFRADSEIGASYKAQLHYAFYIRKDAVNFAAGEYADVQINFTSVTGPNGALPVMVHRHMLIPGIGEQLLHGVFVFTVSASSSSGYFTYTIFHTHTEGVYPGSTVPERGYFSYRAIA